ncbi:MAG: dockerin type I repeat-containing protein [Clostridia bacterium]|nr:dockerin type I repeat-containing protein [Clostridia bacterium]
MKNRIICLLAAFALLASLIPAGAFAFSAGAEDTIGPDVIQYVELLGFHPPLLGETTEQNVSSISVFPDAPYTIKSLRWLTDRNDEVCYMEGFETFEDGGFYWLEISLLPKTGNRFKNGVDPTFSINNSTNYANNDRAIYIESDGSAAFYSVVLASEVPGGIIDAVNIYGVFYPGQDESVGNNRSAIYVSDDSHCTIQSVTWNRYAPEDESGTVILDDDETFAAGNDYWLHFVIKPDEGYFFDSYSLPNVYIDESTDYLFDSTVRVDNDGNLTLSTVDFTVYDLFDGTEITSLEIEGFSVPYIGDTVEENVVSIFLADDSPCALLYALWDDGVVVMEDSDVFKKDVVYSLAFYIMPAEGYYFPPLHLNITINGSTTYVHGTYNIEPDGTLICYTIDLEAEEPAEYAAGDVNCDGEVNSDDAIYLLRHTLFAGDYPVHQDCDFTHNGFVNSDDAIYLLRHVLFPEDYPLE